MEFCRPTGPDGNLWFSEVNGNKIGRVTTSGSFAEFPVPTSAGMSLGPGGITAATDGNLWFTETGANKIGRVSPAGVFSEYDLGTASPGPARTGGQPDWAALGPDGGVWFSGGESNYIGRIETGGPPPVVPDLPLPAVALVLASIGLALRALLRAYRTRRHLHVEGVSQAIQRGDGALGRDDSRQHAAQAFPDLVGQVLAMRRGEFMAPAQVALQEAAQLGGEPPHQLGVAVQRRRSLCIWQVGLLG